MSVPGVCQSILNSRHTGQGHGSLDTPEKFLNQDFQQLRQYFLIRQARCIDDMFPPDRRSIGPDLLKPAELSRVQWLRPRDLVQNPALVVDGISRFDFEQGIVGNCWFLASIGALTFQKDILSQVVPLDQSFDENYCGLFHFRFWRFGRWVDVVIDDKLPTIDGKLIFVRSNDPTEFWPSLLEKAYAKVCGSYSDMNMGSPAEALMDFTGGVHINVVLSAKARPPDLWELMCRAGQSKSLMCCGTHPGETAENTVLPNGLVQGHAYAVTGVKEVMSRGRVEKLVRLWNPWGSKEWNGDWSDQSPLWKTVSSQDRDLCLAVFDDGEFWMPLEDFCKNYSDMDICCLSPNFLDGNSACHWKKSFHEGRWVAGTTAGGSPMNQDSFWTNPQYRVQIEQQKCPQSQGERNVMVSLMQKPDKRNRRLVKSLHIGFSIFAVPEEYKRVQGKFQASFFTPFKPVAQTKDYMNAREVMKFVTLPPGEYLIVPSTYKPNETATFLLTILSKAETHVHESSTINHRTNEEKEQKPHEENGTNDNHKKMFYRQVSDQYEEVDAEQLQALLNERILKGDLKSGGFSVDACRSMVALMDSSISGKLDNHELNILWNKITTLKDIFYRTDVDRTGTLNLRELRNAVMAVGMGVSDDMLNLMAVRYGASSGHMTLENFLSLALRFECMAKIFKKLSSGMTMTLRESDWMYVSMYT